MNSKVVLSFSEDYNYPDENNNFRPSQKYPEYPFEDYSDTANTAYDAVRNALWLAGYDAENYGKANWNPFKDLVKPGDNVLIKPNLVMDFNPVGGTDCLITNPSVVAAVVDYTLIALGSKGKIVIGDAPMQECNFDNIINKCGYGKLYEYYRSHTKTEIELVDFRELTSVVKNGVHYQEVNDKSSGTVINLGENSEFYDATQEESERFRITNYDPRILPTHHHGTVQEYYVSNYVLSANVVINMPKPKSHRKAGATISLKNLVGINTRKEFLPHHTQGAVADGGDEYKKKSVFHKALGIVLDRKNIIQFEGKHHLARLYNPIINALYIFLDKTNTKYYEGSWYGNHTISRTITDLNKILKYADKNGNMQNEPQRKSIIIADMIISGDKEGPVRPSPKQAGIIALGENPVAFDKVIATVMGFDYKKIPTICCAEKCSGQYVLYNNEKPFIISNKECFNKKHISELEREDLLNYEPTSGWKGHIEL